MELEVQENNNCFWLSNIYKITKIKKKTKAKGLENLSIGDVLVIEIPLTKRGSDRNYNWKRPVVHFRISANNKGLEEKPIEKEFSIAVKIINNCFELEVLP